MDPQRTAAQEHAERILDTPLDVRLTPREIGALLAAGAAFPAPSAELGTARDGLVHALHRLPRVAEVLRIVGDVKP